MLKKIQPKKSKKREEFNSNHFQYRNTEVVEIENLLQKKESFLVELVSVEEKAILNEIKF